MLYLSILQSVPPITQTEEDFKNNILLFSQITKLSFHITTISLSQIIKLTLILQYHLILNLCSILPEHLKTFFVYLACSNQDPKKMYKLYVIDVIYISLYPSQFPHSFCCCYFYCCLFVKETYRISRFLDLPDCIHEVSISMFPNLLNLL